jgi:hypothetical protein
VARFSSLWNVAGLLSLKLAEHKLQISRAQAATLAASWLLTALRVDPLLADHRRASWRH